METKLADPNQTSEWPAYGLNHYENRFSPLADIDTKSVKNLAVDWYLDLPSDKALVSTPLVIDGILYFTGTGNIVRAVNATNGELKWAFDPQLDKHLGTKRKAGWSQSRGISYYNSKIYNATWDGRLIAIDAGTGQEVWSVQTYDPDKAFTITGAPKAFKGKVLIGNGGSESGPNRGYVTAYDAETGQQIWRFYIVPGDPAKGFENDAMAMAAKTWTGEWWKLGGGGNAWHGFTYDPDLDQLYIGTGNGGPWNRELRSPQGGDNLFLCSIVALDPDDGNYLWHYQTTPGESWDYNSNMDILLTDLTIKGEKIKALLHAPKNGFFYVINRATGKLISAKPFVETTWASAVDSISGRPIEIPGSRYLTDTAYISPSPHGAHSWHAMSYHPGLGLAFIPTIHDAARYTQTGLDHSSFRSIDFKGGIGVKLFPPDKLPRPYSGSLQAWDPVIQKQVWQVPHDELWNAGTLVTGGNLVFQGRANGKFYAYKASTGEVLWSYDAGLGISAPPITYKINGKQYLALLVGWGGAFAGVGDKVLGWEYGIHTRRLLVFSLEGKATVPRQPPPFVVKPLIHPEFVIDPVLAKEGKKVYGACSGCHGPGLIAMGMAPDLRISPLALNLDLFRQVVKNGIKVKMGMPAFQYLSDSSLLAIMHYIREEAHGKEQPVEKVGQ
jgi:quinohemoprotein ethanol dehydrogenase